MVAVPELNFTGQELKDTLDALASASPSMSEARLAAMPTNVTGSGALWQVPFDTTQHRRPFLSHEIVLLHCS